MKKETVTETMRDLLDILTRYADHVATFSDENNLSMKELSLVAIAICLLYDHLKDE